MDLGDAFLALSLLFAALAVNALRPPRWPPGTAMPSSTAGWLTAELVPHHLVLQGAIAMLFIANGALDSLSGRAASAIAAATWLALGHCQRLAFRARRVMSDALRGALGVDWDLRIDRAGHDRLPADLCWARVAWPFAMRRSDVEVLRGIVFGREGGVTLRLDLFRPSSRPSGCPALVFVHGGAWMLDLKKFQGRPMMWDLAAQGWVCATIDYRLSPRATFPDHLIDVKRGIAWMRRHGPEYGADPRFIVVSGNSAGGHLSALAALTRNDPEYQPGFADDDTSVAGCVSFYGVYDLADRDGIWPSSLPLRAIARLVMKRTPEEDPAAYDRSAPLMRVRPDAPPFLIVHGDRDSLAPVEGARRFRNALAAVSRSPVAYAEIPGGHHAFDVFRSVRTQLTLAGVYRFLAWLRSRHEAVSIAGAHDHCPGPS